MNTSLAVQAHLPMHGKKPEPLQFPLLDELRDGIHGLRASWPGSTWSFHALCLWQVVASIGCLVGGLSVLRSLIS